MPGGEEAMLRLKIALIGLFGRPNFGNEATIHAFLFHLRKRLPQAQLACITASPTRIKERYDLDLIPIDPLPIPNVWWRIPARVQRAYRFLARLLTEPWRARRAKALIKGYDWLVAPGTGIFDDFGQGPLDMPYHILRWTNAATSVRVGRVPRERRCVRSQQQAQQGDLQARGFTLDLPIFPRSGIQDSHGAHGISLRRRSGLP